MTELIRELEPHIRDIPDFPKPGIVFKDITPLLNNSRAFQLVIDYFAKRYKSQKISKVIGIESRGFIFGAPLAVALNAGFVLVRKPGKLPYKTEKEEYSLEYGTDCVEIHIDAVQGEDNVVIIDDLIATGGTAAATGALVTRLGARIHEFAFVCDLTFLKGTEKLHPHPYHSLLKY